VRNISSIPVPEFQRLLGLVWCAFGIYWVANAWGNSAAESTEPNRFRVSRLGILAATFVLLLVPWLGFKFLNLRFIPENLVARSAGVALMFAGMALAISARRHLGRNWSDKVELKVDHCLIRSGPYAYLRHPIYSGVLLGVAGTALAVGMVRGIAAFLLLLSSYAIKARKEERALAAKFGDAFREHRREAGFLFPRIGGPAA
jgi:protein-S-isoprenylcysteine O-methyltransferase Ste14